MRPSLAHMPPTFEDFLGAFDYEDGWYVPRNASDNRYRHFGMRRSGRLYMRYREVLYLYSNIPPEDADLETSVYFYFKENDMNILFDGQNENIYKKKKHFNRDRDAPIGRYMYRYRDDEVEFVDGEVVIAVGGESSFGCVKCRPLDDFETGADDELRRK